MVEPGLSATTPAPSLSRRWFKYAVYASSAVGALVVVHVMLGTELGRRLQGAPQTVSAFRW